jgi:acyl-CoA reductase-like NAD-dependent aldehyde dehydrogenase
VTALQDVPVRKIIRAVADASARWADADFPPRVRILNAIAERTKYSIPVIEYALDRLFESITESGVTATIANELGSIDMLDGFIDRNKRPPARALPVGCVAVISSRTTIGVAIVPAVFALCAKNDVVVKDREDQLVAAFFRTLTEEHDAFSSAARADTWPGSKSETSAKVQTNGEHSTAHFDCVVAFGKNETLAEIRAACSPSARFIGFGSKASAGYISRESLHDERSVRTIAEGAARDLVLYETEGCLSLHALFVERGGALSPEDFMTHLGTAIERTHVELPIEPRDAGTAACVMAARDLAEFRSATGSERSIMLSDKKLSYFLILDPPRTEPPLFLPCALPIFSVNAPAEALTYLHTNGISLEALAVDVARSDIVEFAMQSGVSRIARFGELQSPLLEANHGGRPRITDFVRWITDET